jgi:hypothetical protein
MKKVAMMDPGALELVELPIESWLLQLVPYTLRVCGPEGVISLKNLLTQNELTKKCITRWFHKMRKNLYI